MSRPGMTAKWRVDGRDTTPDGYRDDLLYLGDSRWQALKAWRAARREGMEVSLTRAGVGPSPEDPPVVDKPRRWTHEHPGGGRIDSSGVEWFACDPYPTWYRRENGELITPDSALKWGQLR